MKTRLLTGRTIPSLLTFFLRRLIAVSKLHPVTIDTDLFQTLGTKYLWLAIAGTMGSRDPDRGHSPSGWNYAYAAKAELPTLTGRYVGYSENPYEYLEEG